MQEDCKKKELMSVLGQTVKQLRLEKAKSIYRISAEASMSKATWREVELGLCKDVTLSTLYKISDGLEISISDLLQKVNSTLGEGFSLTD